MYLGVFYQITFLSGPSLVFFQIHQHPLLSEQTARIKKSDWLAMNRPHDTAFLQPLMIIKDIFFSLIDVLGQLERDCSHQTWPSRSFQSDLNLLYL